MKPVKKRVLAAAFVLLVLAAAFWYGGGAPGLQGWTAKPEASTGAPAETGTLLETEQSAPETQAPEEDAPEDALPQPEVGEGSSSAPPAESAPPLEDSQAPESAAPSAPAELTCTISIRCDSILDHLDWLDPDKAELVPGDGVLLAETLASFAPGESVFDVLQRETRAAGLHMEYVSTPGYGSVYIEGIANLYEFDCGQQSGWIYFVNGSSPGYGCSGYALADGDRIEWVYTCDLGRDVGAPAVGG